MITRRYHIEKYNNKTKSNYPPCSESSFVSSTASLCLQKLEADARKGKQTGHACSGASERWYLWVLAGNHG